MGSLTTGSLELAGDKTSPGGDWLPGGMPIAWRSEETQCQYKQNCPLMHYRCSTGAIMWPSKAEDLQKDLGLKTWRQTLCPVPCTLI